MGCVRAGVWMFAVCLAASGTVALWSWSACAWAGEWSGRR